MKGSGMNEIGLSEARSTTEHNHFPPGGDGRRWAINLTLVERVGRIALGVAAVIAGAILLNSAGTILAVLLEILLTAAGLDLAVTGGLGHCPLYAKLGHVPKSLRSPR
jgi:hypothetical protein